MKAILHFTVLLLGTALLVQADEPPPNSVYIPPPLGSHIGGGYANSGRSTAAHRIATNRSGETPALANTLSLLDAQAGNIAQGYALALSAVSLQTRVPVATLRRQQSATGMSAADLLVANSLVEGSGRSFAEILALQEKMRAWSPAAHQLGIDVNCLVARARAAQTSMRVAEVQSNWHRAEGRRDNQSTRGNAPGNAGSLGASLNAPHWPTCMFSTVKNPGPKASPRLLAYR